MNPKPFASLNHFTVPRAISYALQNDISVVQEYSSVVSQAQTARWRLVRFVHFDSVAVLLSCFALIIRHAISCSLRQLSLWRKFVDDDGQDASKRCTRDCRWH